MKQHPVKYSLCIALISLAILTTGCVDKPKDATVGEFHAVPINNFAKTWTVDLGLSKGAKAQSVYVFDNLIIVYADDDTAHVVDRLSGQLKFIHELPVRSGTRHAPSILGDKIVYPATSQLKVYSIKTGQLLNQFDVRYALRTAASGSGNNLYIGADHSNGGRLEALDLSRNNSLPRWELMTVAPLRAAPIYYKGIVYMASEDGIVRAVNEEKHSVWSLDDKLDGSFATSGPIVADIRVDESGLYVASTDTKLYCLKLSNGKIKWQYFAGVPLDQPPYTTNDTLYINIKGRGLTAISKLEGEFNRKPKWSTTDAVQFLADDDKYTYVLLKSNQVAALDKATGELKFTSNRKDLTHFGINMRDGLVYATDGDGNLLQIKPVVRQGVVGELVMIVRPLELASR